ncbi:MULTISPECIES: SSI family serine proteinase inhibitor [unclassified Streptomyces]|uniref:SSI family serine proteinase inhibitor n=1 Tax=unclassified Streptomyces TaxID=2593676 RepID=UPI000B01EE31|nr:SSI family serine proteinase inhibitor [Streptomyces sp. NRRL F-5727]
MLLRRLVLATVLATGLAGASAGASSAVPMPPLPPLPLLSSPDSLTVTVSGSGIPEADGSWKLTCDGRAGGDHPAAERACERLEGFARAGENPFAPVPADRMCTQIYGGPVTAQVTGTWQGRRIDARFSRSNGCEIDRWENVEPLLPSVRA